MTRARSAAIVACLALLAGCGPAPEPSTAARTAGPAPSIAATPSPAPTAAVGGPYAEAVIAALGAEDLTTHVFQTAELTSTIGDMEQSLTATMDGDISGEDVAFVLSIGIGGEEVTQELRVLGDTAWVRQDDEWISAPRRTVDATVAGLLDNIRVVEDPSQLRYVGPETIDGQALHRLAAVGEVPYLPASGGTGRYEALDVWIEEDGTPVLVRGRFTAEDAAGNVGSGSTEIRFSAFGDPVEIEPPVE